MLTLLLADPTGAFFLYGEVEYTTGDVSSSALAVAAAVVCLTASSASRVGGESDTASPRFLFVIGLSSSASCFSGVREELLLSAAINTSSVSSVNGRRRLVSGKVDDVVPRSLSVY